jgi:hypothetical protein
VRWLFLALAAPGSFAAAPDELAGEIRKLELDPNACYRVRDVTFQREDLRFYLTEGTLTFAQPVAGRRLAAIFTADVEGGDAELLLMPPTRGERLSLAAFTGSPNLSEHFAAAIFVFTDDTEQALMRALRNAGELRPSMERGLLMASKWNGAVSNIAQSFGVRLVHHLLGGSSGFFYSGIQGVNLGNFDAYCDANSVEQIFLGQIKYRDNRAFYDYWTSFPARSYRTGASKASAPHFRLDNFRIEAELDSQLHLRALARMTLKAERDMRVVPLDLSERMAVKSAKLDGVSVPVFHSESMRANLARRNESVLFLLIAPTPIAAGSRHEVEIEYEGTPVREAGRDVYFVSTRGNWYPRHYLDWSTFDITFTYPSNLQIVFPGDLKGDKTEGLRRSTRRVTASPIRLAGFNLGRYESTKETRGKLSVEVYANRNVEPGLRVPAPVVIPQPQVFPPRRTPQLPPAVMQLPPPDPTRRLEPLAKEVAEAFQFLATHFGPPALDTLQVAPIPGAFGQGFPGLVYLSTLAYLDPNERPAVRGSSQLFFSEILHAHETAHQWWGNVVTSAGGQDDWIMEALANYSALMILEKKKGPKALNQVLDEYRSKLLSRDADGKTLESAGPIRLGGRLINSQAPESWHSIVYGKGTWIIHMMRKRLGDAQFLKMLGDFAKRYRNQAVSARQFQDFAASYLPKGSRDPRLESFFEQWVENTGIPTLALATQLKGRAPSLQLTLTVTQTDVGDDFSIPVPVEIQSGPRTKPQVIWVNTGSDPGAVDVPLRVAPAKVTLDPENSILMVRK